jgi:hypothetical protein
MSRGLALCALLLAVVPRAAFAGDASLTLETLMQRMAATSGVRAEFRETRQIALLEAPLVSEGTLWFVPPGRMARWTRKPTLAAFVIDGPRLAYRDAAGGDVVDLSANRIARTVVENFMSLFNGDVTALRERYHVDFHAEGARWRLELVPRDSRVASVVQRVKLRGDGPALHEMIVEEEGGDRTVTAFHDVRTDVSFDPAELARIFDADAGAPPP